MSSNDDDVKEASPAGGKTKRIAKDGEDLSAPSHKKPKRVKTKQMDPQELEFRRLIQQCCKIDDPKTALTAYDKTVTAKIRIEAQTFYNLLNLCDGLGERGIHIGTPRETVSKQEEETKSQTKSNGFVVAVDDTTRLKYAERIKAHMDELGLPLTEAAYTALVRLHARTDNVEKAEKMLSEAESTQQCKPKIRMYAALLYHYCRSGELLKAVRIWLRASQQGLVLTEKEYSSLLRCCAIVGNAVVTERVLSDLAEDVFVPSRETCHAIIQWFESPHAVVQQQQDASHSSNDAAIIGEMLQKIESPYITHQQQMAASMGPVQCSDIAGWSVSRDCRVDDAGIFLSGCLQGASLQPVSLSDQAWQDMKRMNETIATVGKLDVGCSEFQGGGKGRKVQVDSKSIARRQQRWKEFQIFLDRRSQKQRIDVVLDGANIGYRETNFANAPKHVDYQQIDFVVDHFLRLNKSVLLVMHSRHFSSPLMPKEALPLKKKWTESGVLFQTPPGMNDDWFWLHAALYAGPGTLVVTNDEMRDHHFQMVAPRSFLCWRDRHQIHFEFGKWIKKEREVLLTYPDRYSRRIQRVLDGLVVPLPKRGDENRFLDGMFVADKEVPVDETYLCIRPSRTSDP